MKRILRKYYVNQILCLTLCLVLILTSVSCTRQNDVPVTASDIFFDTVITITLYDYSGSSDDILNGCKEKCAFYESLFSPYIPGSDIWNINNAASYPVIISSETAKMLNRAMEYGDLSDGLIDVTIGPLTGLWDVRNQSGSDDPHIPADDQIKEALSHVDYHNIEICLSGTADMYELTLKDPDAAIEPGCIAKGYIADILSDYLKEAGVKSAVINLGGNISLIGSKPDGSPFNVGIQYPFKDRGESITNVSCSDTSVVSSGTYERYFIYKDTVYHHILDPRTGYPADSGVLSASVRCKSSTDADALSTLCLILGADEGLSLIESLSDTEVLFVTDDYDLIQSSGW